MKKSTRKVIRKSANGMGKAKATNGKAKLKTKTASPKTQIVDKKTMREFSTKSLAPVPIFKPLQIKKIRESENVSQAVFAAHLNISASAVKKWETGEKRPHGTSLLLLRLISKKGLSAIF
jgi:putative transcriptional regulator